MAREQRRGILSTALALVAGVALALMLARVAQSRGPIGARRVYAVGLLLAALVYVVLAGTGGSSVRWLVLELSGVVLFGAAAWVGFRHWPVILASAWGAHVAWDVLLHLEGGGAAYTPFWYPWFCVGFDLAIAGAILASERRVAHSVSGPAA